jgi:dTDP-4-dehydrorhamnose 3,5-epimerase
VHSRPGVFRGMHFHRRHDEYFALLTGKAAVGLRDLRPWSPTYGAHALFEVTGDRPSCIVFPRGLLHGWYFHEDSLHLQAVSESYSDYAAEDNLGCHWSDPGIGIDWPFTEAIVAPRAAGFSSLRTLEKSLCSWTSTD